MRRHAWDILLALVLGTTAQATIFGTIRGLVHDPQHRPIAGAQVTVRSNSSDWQQTAVSGNDGNFEINNVPIGEYTATASAPGFSSYQLKLQVNSGSAPILHFPLSIQMVKESVEVSAAPETVNPDSSTTSTMVSRAQIADTPGADQSNSLKVITDFVPGAYMVHDQLHVRGGHQVTWAVDGVPIPNTNIASNVGPQFDPKDIDYIEVQRGSYSAEYGDRTYGVFNVAPRSGFERDKQGELVLSYGNFNTTDNQLSFGDHSSKFAYYASLNGNRTDYALEPPTPLNLHNQGVGGGGFTSMTYNATPKDQLRFSGGSRVDYYQVPNDPGAQDGGVRDREREQDAYGIVSWVHSSGPGLTWNVSPFYHFNRAAFEGGPLDMPAATDNRAGQYAGGQAAVSIVKGRHNARAGVYSFWEHDNTLFGIVANDGSGTSLSQRVKESGAVDAVFLEDQFKATSWLTLNGGVRYTHFSGAFIENSADPRVGAAITLPRLHWVLRGAYSRFYQAPPLETVSGPLLNVAATQGFGFLPLKGERDEQHEIGLAIPVRGWTADLVYFRTGARNFFDHDVLGNSNIFFPLTIDHVRVIGYEATLRSPKIMNHADVHLAYSHQSAEGQGGVTGGLTSFSPPPQGFFYLDHDQRDTLSLGMRTDLPWRSWLAGNMNYGSGFLNGNGPAHLPAYATLDLSVGKSFGENWSAKVTATNLNDKRYQLDTSNTFGGSHFANPRMMSVEMRYRFHY